MLEAWVILRRNDTNLWIDVGVGIDSSTAVNGSENPQTESRDVGWRKGYGPRLVAKESLVQTYALQTEEVKN